MVCPGSVALIERLEADGTIPRERSSSFAAEGTVAHEVRSLSLELGLDACDWIGKTFSADGVEFEVTEEMAAHLQPGMDRVRERPGLMSVERRAHLDHWLPGQWGTLDCGIHDPAGRVIHIDDLKYGAGVPVGAVGNRQLHINALGFWRHFCEADNRIERFVLTIDSRAPAGSRRGRSRPAIFWRSARRSASPVSPRWNPTPRSRPARRDAGSAR